MPSLSHPRPEFSPPVGQLTFRDRTWAIYDLWGSWLVCDENGHASASFPLSDLNEVGTALTEAMADADR